MVRRCINHLRTPPGQRFILHMCIIWQIWLYSLIEKSLVGGVAKARRQAKTFELDAGHSPNLTTTGDLVDTIDHILKSWIIWTMNYGSTSYEWLIQNIRHYQQHINQLRALFYGYCICKSTFTAFQQILFQLKFSPMVTAPSSSQVKRCLESPLHETAELTGSKNWFCDISLLKKIDIPFF
jgi:hypothetical protein